MASLIINQHKCNFTKHSKLSTLLHTNKKKKQCMEDYQ